MVKKGKRPYYVSFLYLSSALVMIIILDTQQNINQKQTSIIGAAFISENCEEKLGGKSEWQQLDKRQRKKRKGSCAKTLFWGDVSCSKLALVECFCLFIYIFIFIIYIYILFKREAEKMMHLPKEWVKNGHSKPKLD